MYDYPLSKVIVCWLLMQEELQGRKTFGLAT